MSGGRWLRSAWQAYRRPSPPVALFQIGLASFLITLLVALTLPRPQETLDLGLSAGDQGSAALDLVPTMPVVPDGVRPQDLPPVQSAPGIPQPGLAPFGVTTPGVLTASGIPVRAYRAYVRAAGLVATAYPTCRLSWGILAGIGRVESNHGRFAGSTLLPDGLVSPPILGIRLDGATPGTTSIADSDKGAYDGDSALDRAVGPMQFLPATWSSYGADGDGDRRADPQDIDDAAFGAARYLCSGGADLSTEEGRWAAVYRYNRSASYVSLVLSLADSYATGKIAPFPTPPAGVLPPVDGPQATPSGPPPALPAPAPSSGRPTPGPAVETPGVVSPALPAKPAPSRPIPSTAPTPSPTGPPPSPTGGPTPSPTGDPTPSPTGDPTPSPTGDPTPSPTCDPSPTDDPAPSPSDDPPPAPSDTGPADDPATTPAGSGPAESSPAESSPAESSPAESSPAESSPAESSPAESSPAADSPA